MTKPEKRTSKGKGLAKTSTEVAAQIAGAGVGLVLGGPLGAMAGAVTPTAVNRALEALGVRYGEKREARAGFVIAKAASVAGVDPGQVIERLESDPEREELLVRTLRVAHDAALAEKLVALALALAKGYEDPTGEAIAWETLFVRALDDCDAAHLELLGTFVQSSNELGFGDGSEAFDNAPEGLNRAQLDLARQQYATVMDALLSTLERHGLVRGATYSRGLTVGIDHGMVTYRLTSFGAEFLDRLSMIRESLKG